MQQLVFSHWQQLIVFGFIIILPMSASGFLQPTTSPNCVRSLAGRLELEADCEATAGIGKHHSSVTGLTANISQDEPKVEFQLRESRDSIFHLMVLVGEASALFLDETAALGINKKRTEQVLAQILIALIECAKAMKVDLEKACHAKIELNLKKYPVELCKGKAGKYTEYSNSTGITKTFGQSTACATVLNEDNDWTATFLDQAVPVISLRAQSFATARDWLPYHTPRNILLALAGEVGELAELLQFKGDQGTIALSTSDEMKKISQELADVTIYLLRLSDVTGTDVGQVALDLQIHASTNHVG